MAIQTVNPATGEVVQTFDELDDAGIEDVLARAADVFERHRRLSLAERAECMNKAADILEQDQDRWGAMMTEEMGKPLKAAVAEAVKCAWVCRYYAEHAEAFLADEPMESDASDSFVRYLPMGPVLAVMPWNFPFWQVFRFAAPALMAGNVGLLKHASNVPQSALAIEEIFDRAGFEKGTFQTLLVGSAKVEKILKDHRVKAATLTGSEGAGAAVAATAGEEIKHTVLELGGSDPFIIMPSADVDKALETAVTARNINNGQSCIAAKRFIVHQDIYDDFEARFVAKFEGVTVGDPMSDDTDIGPLAMAQIRDEIDEQVAQSVAKGARKLTGAEVMDGPGYFYRPGILADIPEDSPAYYDEIFGPVALLFKATDLDDAIRIGNATRFGLGSSVWTNDEAEIDKAATELEAGCTFVNSMVASDPRLPFGGVKASGYGRELSRDGIREFVNRKTISIA
jgi:succinate-semialdehyde dehydrogenase/glutarate-semialdehyde dehydrogenase